MRIAKLGRELFNDPPDRMEGERIVSYLQAWTSPRRIRLHRWSSSEPASIFCPPTAGEAKRWSSRATRRRRWSRNSSNRRLVDWTRSESNHCRWLRSSPWKIGFIQGIMQFLAKYKWRLGFSCVDSGFWTDRWHCGFVALPRLPVCSGCSEAEFKIFSGIVESVFEKRSPK